MSELRICCPEYWKKLKDRVYNKYKDRNGYYYSAKSGFKSKNRLLFQIDHIIPFSEGGLTKLDDLQLLTRQENMEKRNKIETTNQDNLSDNEKEIP